jgi:hypothetical protein
MEPIQYSRVTRLEELRIYSKKEVPYRPHDSILEQTIPHLRKPRESSVQLRIARKIMGLDHEFNWVQHQEDARPHRPKPVLLNDFSLGKTLVSLRTAQEKERPGQPIFLDHCFDMVIFLDFLDEKFPNNFIVLDDLVKELDPHLADALSPLPQAVLSRGDLLRLLRIPKALERTGQLHRQSTRDRNGLSAKARKLLVGHLVATFRQTSTKNTF